MRKSGQSRTAPRRDWVALARLLRSTSPNLGEDVQHRRILLVEFLRAIGRDLTDGDGSAVSGGWAGTSHLATTTPPARSAPDPGTTEAVEPVEPVQLRPVTEVEPGHDLSPRRQQTLRRLLAGESEKQIASHLGLSRHTVHVHVKAIYRHYGVTSRAELLSRWIGPRAPTDALAS